MLKVNEIFLSIQGEGKFTGYPSFFIRLFGCNLKCSFCDSMYANTDNNYTEYDVKELAEKINSLYQQNKFVHLVITGGEPLLQMNELKELFKLINKEIFIEIETNGSIKPDFKDIPNTIQYNISPKLQFDYKIKNICHTFDIIYKFVDDGTKECRERIEKFVSEYDAINRSMIYIMPEGKTIDEQEKKYLNTVKYCMEKGFIYCHRVHISLWNGKKGV
ncbi:7-carboxy-7-deazaguanine synthase QueE [bacterium]|nr:7-carboxy-7-deazaguanine synthase QueE [bacterium]